MLVIRKQQIQEFIARDETELVDVVCQAVREANGERVSRYADAELADMVEISIERARSFELTAAEDIASFVAIMFEIAPRFYEQPDIRKILDNSDFPPESRVEKLFTCLGETPWVEAQKMYDDSFWFPGED